MRKTVGIVLEESAKREIRMICAARDWQLAHFFERAMEACIERIKEGDKAGVGVALRDMPAGLPNTSIWVSGELVTELEDVTGPGIVKRVVYYTAIHDFLEETRHEDH